MCPTEPVEDEDFLLVLDMPAREDGRIPEREEGLASPPVRLGGRCNGLARSVSSNMLSILAAERRALEEEDGMRPRTVGRVSLSEGAWPGLDGECC